MGSAKKTSNYPLAIRQVIWNAKPPMQIKTRAVSKGI